MPTFIIECDDYINDKDESIDVVEMIFPREQWATVTTWLEEKKCQFWVEKYSFDRIFEYLFKGYEHLYLMKSTVPSTLLKKYPLITKDNWDERTNVLTFFLSIEKEVPPTDQQIERHKNVWWEEEPYFVAYKEYKAFIEKQWWLPFYEDNYSKYYASCRECLGSGTAFKSDEKIAKLSFSDDFGKVQQPLEQYQKEYASMLSDKQCHVCKGTGEITLSQNNKGENNE